MSQTPVNGISGYQPSPYLVNNFDLNNTITNASGITSGAALSNAVSNIQQMVNFDQKRIFINTISKFNTTPIQVTDSLNLSNANLYVDGTAFVGGGGGGGTSFSTTGGTGIYLQSTPTESNAAILFQVGLQPVFQLDGQGRGLFYGSTNSRFWVSSATLVADRAQFLLGGTAAPGKNLVSLDTVGNVGWSYARTLQDSPSSIQVSISSAALHNSSVLFFNAGGTPGGFLDIRRNWCFGQSTLTKDADLSTSNDIIVINGGLRMKCGASEMGSFLKVIDTQGNIGFSTITSELSSFVIGDTIAADTTSVHTLGTDNSIRFVNDSIETARFTQAGRLGLQTSVPEGTLDVNGTTFLRGSVQLSGIGTAAGFVLTAQNTAGNARWLPVTRIADNIGNSVRIAESNSIQMAINHCSVATVCASSFSVHGRGVFDSTITTQALASIADMPFSAGGREHMRIGSNGNVGIGTSTPVYKLHVMGDIYSLGTITASNVTSAFTGDGSKITNIEPVNIGTDVRNLYAFQDWSTSNVAALRTGLSSMSCSISSITMNVGFMFYSTLSSQIISSGNTLSSMIGPGASVEISSFSTALCGSLNSIFSTISTSIYINTLTAVSSYTSNIAFGITSTFGQNVIFSTLRRSGLAVGYTPHTAPSTPYLLDINGSTRIQNGALDVSGIVNSRGVFGMSSPFVFGVGTTSTMSLTRGAYSPGENWRMTLQGDIDISGYLYHNGSIYHTGSIPDFYWGKNGSNVFYADGNVGIGVIAPSYPLDVAGRIRCWGVDTVQGPGPTTCNTQGDFVSPWSYQSSNIYYNLGGVGIGSGVSSVKEGLYLDISGAVRQRYGPVYFEQSTFAVGHVFGSATRGSFDVSGSAHCQSLFVDDIGQFGGQVTASNFLTPSDARLKERICAIDGAGATLDRLRGVTFRWRESGAYDCGFLAQEIASVLPVAAGMDIRTGYMTVAYDKLVPYLVETVKDLRARMTALEKLVGEKVANAI